MDFDFLFLPNLTVFWWFLFIFRLLNGLVDEEIQGRSKHFDEHSHKKEITFHI